MSNTLADAAARSAAVDIQKSVIVSAPAGSGKTGLLSLRVLKLLAHVERPEEILAITFTRKAAAEMRERIFSALTHADSKFHEFTDDSEPTQSNDFNEELGIAARAAVKRNRQQNWKLLENRYRLRILTIDGFCKGLSEQLPFFSGLGTNAGIVDPPMRIFHEAVEQWIHDKLKNDSDKQFLLLLSYLRGNLARLSELMCSLLAKREQWLGYTLSARNNIESLREDSESLLQQLIDGILNNLEYRFAPYEAQLHDLLKFASKHASNEKNIQRLSQIVKYDAFPKGIDERSAYWRAMAGLLLTGDGNFRKTVDKGLGFLPGDKKNPDDEFTIRKSQILAILAELREMEGLAQELKQAAIIPDGVYGDAQWSMLQALVQFLPELSAYLKLAFAREASCDFTEFALSAVQALNSDENGIALQEKLDFSLRHILIDEFQDTSQIQLELLLELIKDWQFDPDKTLFLVGDAMQSCYNFRNANVGIFLNILKSGLPGINLEPLALTVNFRSKPELIDWINAVFEIAFPSDSIANMGSVKYSHSSAFADSDITAGVECKCFIDDDDGVQEALHIVNQIQEYKTAHPERSIAVLARAKSHLRTIIDLLKSREIDYQAIDIDPLTSKQHIIDLLNILRVVVNPTDEIAWLGVLRAPWCALGNRDLFHLFNFELNHGTQSSGLAKEGVAKKRKETRLIWNNIQQHLQSEQLSEDAKEQLAKIAHIFNGIFEQRNRHNLSRVVEVLWSKLGGPCTLRSQAELTDIETFLALLDKECSSSGIADLSVFNQKLANLFAAPASGENPVQLMTMHKSKGLEFDYVFLPKLHKQKVSDKQQLLYWMESLSEENQQQFLLSPLARDTKDVEDLLTMFIRDQIKQKQEYEDTRIFYVACTRAKQKLFLSASRKTNTKSELSPPPSSSLLAKIWASSENEFLAVNNSIHTESSQPKSIEALKANEIQRIKKDWQFLPAYSDSDLKDSAFDNSDFKFSQSWQEQDNNARAAGIVFHRILKASFDPALRNKASSTTKIAVWARLLLKEGHDPEAIESRVEEFEQTLERLSADEKAQWIFDGNHEASVFEFAMMSGSSSATHIVDRSFIDKGVRWIIDFKTATPPADLDPEQFFRHEKQQYRSQLDRYKALFEVLDSQSQRVVNETRCALFFPMTGRFEEYTD